MDRYSTAGLPLGQPGLTFPLTKTVLWDHEPHGQPTSLHLTASHNPQVCIDTLILQLAHKYAEDSGSYLCTLVGSMIPDSTGIQIHVDRFEPDWNDSGLGSTHNNSVSMLIPGDIAIPCMISKSDEHQTPVADYIATLRTLQKRLGVSDRVGLHSYLTLKATCSVTRREEVRVEFDLITLTTKLLAVPVAAVPLLATPLCRNLMSPLNMGELQGEAKMGYLTMDHTRKLIVMMDNDPKVQNLPLVGIWVTGVEDVTDPYCWCASLKYLHCCSLKDRICMPPEPFLLVVFSSVNQHPQYYDVVMENGGDMGTQYELNAGMEFVQLTKNHPDSSRRGVELDLIRIENGPKYEAFSSATEQMTIIPEREVPRKVDDLVPRTSPAPHQTVKSVVSSPLHEVPEVSLLGEENFQERGQDNRVLLTYFNNKKKDKENTKPKDLNNNQGSKPSKMRQKIESPQGQVSQANRVQRPRSPVPTSCYQPRYQSPPHYYPYDAYGQPVFQQSYPYQGQYYNKPPNYRVPQPYYTSPPQPMYRTGRRQPGPYGPMPYRPAPNYGQRPVQPLMMPSQGGPQSYVSGPLSPNAVSHVNPFQAMYAGGGPQPQPQPPQAEKPSTMSPVLAGVPPPPPPPTQPTPSLPSQSQSQPPQPPSLPPLLTTPAVASSATTVTSSAPTTPTVAQAPGLQTYSIDQNGTPTTITTTPDVYALIKNQDAQLKMLQQQLQMLLDAQKKAVDQKQETVTKNQVEILTERVQQATHAVNTSLMIAAPQRKLDINSTLASRQTEMTALSEPEVKSNIPATVLPTSDHQTHSGNSDSMFTHQTTRSSGTGSADEKSLFDKSSSSNSDSLHFSLHMTALQQNSSDTTPVSDIVVDLPGYEYSNESPHQGEESPVIQSISMYDDAPPQQQPPQMAEAPEQQVPSEQSSQQGQVHEQVVFYEKLIDNIQHLLEGGPAQDENTEDTDEGHHSRSHNTTVSHNTTLTDNAPRDMALEALDQLRQMTIDMKMEDQENQDTVNKSLCEMEAAVLQKINYVSMMFEDSGDTDLSMEVNALAMKYLGDEMPFSAKKRVQKPVANPTLQVGAFGGGTNMSFATKKYLERHGLMDSFAASKLQSVPEAPDTPSNDITILRDIQPLKIPVLNFDDDLPEKDCSRKREPEPPKYDHNRSEQRYPAAKYEPPQRQEPAPPRYEPPPARPEPAKYEPGAYSGSNSMFSEKSAMMPHSITESQHQRRISSWCRQVEPAAPTMEDEESYISVSECSEISHWGKPTICEPEDDNVTFYTGMDPCEVRPYESTPAVCRRSSGRRTPVDSVRKLAVDGRRTPTENVGRRTPSSSLERRSDGRRTPVENRTLTEDNTNNPRGATNVSNSSHSSTGSHSSQDPPVKDDNYRVFDRPARDVEPLPPVSHSFMERERDVRAQLQDVSAQDNILDIGRLKQLPKLL